MPNTPMIYQQLFDVWRRLEVLEVSSSVFDQVTITGSGTPDSPYIVNPDLGLTSLVATSVVATSVYGNSVDSNTSNTNTLQNGYSSNARTAFSHAEGYNTSTGIALASFTIEEIPGNMNDEVNYIFQGDKTAAFQYIIDSGFNNSIRYFRNNLELEDSAADYILIRNGFISYDSGLNVTKVKYYRPAGDIVSGAFSYDLRYWVIDNFSEENYFIFGGVASHSEGSGSIAIGTGSHSSGFKTYARGDYSTSDGFETYAKGNYSHASGEYSIAHGNFSKAFGYINQAYGPNSIAGGYLSTAGNTGSYAYGTQVNASGEYSHAEGYATYAKGDYSHAEGLGTITSASYQHAQGKYNQTSSTALMLVGNGTDYTNRSNILEVHTSSVVVSGSHISTNSRVTSLSGTGTRVVYADSTGSLVTINNNYTYDTANILASYKVRISGSSAGLTGSFFTTPSNKGFFVPLNCVYMHESGSLSTGTISAGYTLSTPNDFCNDSSVSLSTSGSFEQIPLRTGNGIANSAPPNTTTKWYLSSGGGTNATGTLCITGFYTAA